MTPKQRWYCFWVIIVVSVLLSAGFVWIGIHNPQASFEDLLYALWKGIVNFVKLVTEETPLRRLFFMFRID